MSDHLTILSKRYGLVVCAILHYWRKRLCATHHTRKTSRHALSNRGEWFPGNSGVLSEMMVRHVAINLDVFYGHLVLT
jgi:hypothetical protein